MSDLKQDKRNTRKRDADAKSLIRHSLQKFGAGRSGVADADGVMIAGNGVLEEVEKLGMPIKEIETDGTEFIVIKRTDISNDNPLRDEMALADNATALHSEWDFDMIAELEMEDVASGWGVEIEEDIDFDNINSNEDREPTDNTKIVTCQNCGTKISV